MGDHDIPFMGRERLVYYREEQDDLFIPLDTGFTGWRPDQLHGPAITGLLSRSGVRAAAAVDPDLMLIRSGFDLFRRARTVPTTVRTRVVRHGRRVTLIDAFLEQEGDVVARAHLFFAYPGESPDNELWLTDVPVAPPDDTLVHDGHRRLHHCAELGWRTSHRDFPGASRRGLWQRPFEIVEGEVASGYEIAGFVADLTSFVVNSGSRGIHHINVDATVSLARRPRGEGIGLLARQVVEGDGITVGSAVVFDRDGAVGVSTVSAMTHNRKV